MKTSMTLIVAAGFALCLNSCQTPQQLAKNQSAAHEWIKMQDASARIQVSGTWFSQDWGSTALKQTGRDVTGTIDTYEVKGVVSGAKAYLTAWDSGKCYYTIVLTESGHNVLKGSYSDGPTYDTNPAKQRTIELRRSY